MWISSFHYTGTETFKVCKSAMCCVRIWAIMALCKFLSLVPHSNICPFAKPPTHPLFCHPFIQVCQVDCPLPLFSWSFYIWCVLWVKILQSPLSCYLSLSDFKCPLCFCFFYKNKKKAGNHEKNLEISKKNKTNQKRIKLLIIQMKQAKFGYRLCYC